MLSTDFKANNAKPTSPIFRGTFWKFLILRESHYLGVYIRGPLLPFGGLCYVGGPLSFVNPKSRPRAGSGKLSPTSMSMPSTGLRNKWGGV